MGNSGLAKFKSAEIDKFSSLTLEELMSIPVQVISPDGRVQKELSNLNSPIEINISNLSSGLYFIKLSNNLNGSTSITKVIKK